MARALATTSRSSAGPCVALMIVVLLTPAVGGMARLLGVVDRPEAAARDTRARAAARRARALLRDPRARARVPRPRAARRAASCSARRSRRPSAPSTTSAACAGGRSSPARSPPPRSRRLRDLGRPLHVPRRRRPRAAAWVGMPLTVLWIVAIMNMVNFLDGLDGLAAGVCAISGLDVRLIALSLGQAEPASSRRSSSARASASSATTSIRRGSSWATRARCCSASCSRRCPSRAS